MNADKHGSALRAQGFGGLEQAIEAASVTGGSSMAAGAI